MSPWLIASKVVIGAVGVAFNFRRDRLLRSVRTRAIVGEGDLVRPCGFRVRQPATSGTTFPLGRVLVGRESICVRSVLTRKAFCVERSGAVIAHTRVQGGQGLRVAGSPVEFDLYVEDCDSLVEELRGFEWSVEANGAP